VGYMDEINVQYDLDELYAEFYIGENPPGIIFGVSIDGLKEVVRCYHENKPIPLIGISEASGLISAQAYFEGFFFQLFAQVINFCPELLEEFSIKRNEIIEIRKLFIFGLDVRDNLGTLIAENYDFGTPEKVNTLYKDLLGITPFSKDEASKYKQLLTVRNILVHYNGQWASKYIYASDMTSIREKLGEEVTIDETMLLSWIEFLEEIVKKTLNITKKKLIDFINLKGLVYSDRKKEAIEYLEVYLP
jgi:hypothetical protein